jgi:toxin ParE1/3/4
MAKRADRWRVNITRVADSDIREIHRWTEEHFGTAQANAYSGAIAAAIAALLAGPEAPGARPRPDIQAGLYTMHLSRFRRRARHLVVFRIADPAAG